MTPFSFSMSSSRKSGLQDQIGQHVEGQRQVLVENLGVVTHHLLGGEGVEAAADGIHRAGDVLGRAIPGAFEDHVLDKVGNAVLVGRLAAGAGADPNAQRYGTHVSHALGDDADAVGQRRGLNISGLLGCFSGCVH